MEIIVGSLLLIWLLLSSVYILRLLSRKFSGLPPGPIPLPIIGNLHLITPQVHTLLAKLAQTYGPVMSLQLGQVTAVVISSVDVAKDVFIENDQALMGRFIFDAVRAIKEQDLGMVWQPPGGLWKQLRMLYNQQIFSSHSLEASRGLRKRKVDELLAYISELARAGRAVSVRKLVHATLNNIISSIEFSTDIVDLRSETEGDFQALARCLNEEASKPNVADFFPVLRPFDPQGNRKQVGAVLKKLHLFFGKWIEERRLLRYTSAARKNDLVDALLDLQEKEQDSLSDDQMKAQFVELFAAGTDTSSTIIEWAMTELLRRPETLERARAELKEVLGHVRQVEESDMGNLPYLRAVVKEAFRLHPPIPFLLPRLALSDVRVGGFKIPKGSLVLVNLWLIGRDGKHWDQPDKFMPERFLDSKIDFKGRDFDLLPFGGGRRICPGLPLADRIVHFMLASLIHSFNWNLPQNIKPDDLDMSDSYGMVLEKAIPLIAFANQE